MYMVWRRLKTEFASRSTADRDNERHDSCHTWCFWSRRPKAISWPTGCDQGLRIQDVVDRQVLRSIEEVEFCTAHGNSYLLLPWENLYRILQLISSAYSFTNVVHDQ